MKTVAKITLMILVAFLITLNATATGLDFDQEQYIDDIPFDLESIEKQTRYESAVVIDFNIEEEVYIDDLPFSENQLETVRTYTMAINQQFEFEDEGYIDDIPNSISDLISETDSFFYAKAQ